jgi:hypothetical protein
MFTWLKGWFRRMSHSNTFQLILWFIFILSLIYKDCIWLFIWEKENIPVGEFSDVMLMAPYTVILSGWGAYIIVAKVFRTGIAMVIAALVMIALLCNWMMTYAVIYRYVGLIDNGAGSKDGLTCLYFSIVTWTTLGYGDVRPSVAARMIAASEALIGHLWMAMFIGVMAAWLRQMFIKINQPAESADNFAMD